MPSHIKYSEGKLADLIVGAQIVLTVDDFLYKFSRDDLASLIMFRESGKVLGLVTPVFVDL